MLKDCPKIQVEAFQAHFSVDLQNSKLLTLGIQFGYGKAVGKETESEFYQL